MGFRQGAPLPANPRMENFFKRASLGRVAKHYRPECAAIQAAAREKKFRAKCRRNLGLNIIELDQFMGRPIGIEGFHIREKLLQTIAERTLSGGNGASDSDCGHIDPSMSLLCR